MFLLHNLLAKFGYQTETYKAEIFKSEQRITERRS